MFFLVIRLKFNFLTRRAERWRKCWPIIARVQACVLSHCCCVWLFVDCRLLCPWDFPGKNTGVGCHALLHGIFPTQVIKPTSLMSHVLTGGFFTTSTIQGHAITPYLVSSEYFLSLTWYTTFWSMAMSEVYFLCKTRTSLKVGNVSYAVWDLAKSKSMMLNK